MPKRIYQIGEPCDVCGVPTVQGRNGAYCKPCYIKWAEANKQKQPPVQNNNRNFEVETIGKVRHGLICAFIQGKSAEEIAKQMPDFKLKLLMPLERLVLGKPKVEDKVAYKPTEPAELPIIDANSNEEIGEYSNEEVNVDEIPF